MRRRRNATGTVQFDGAGATEELFLAQVHDLEEILHYEATP